MGRRPPRGIVVFTLATFAMGSASVRADEPVPNPPQPDAVDALRELSLEELLRVDVEVNVASRNVETLRETSSVVSLITREDIRRAHARDLLDVLAMVPGFVPTWDVGTASFATRGLYGFEGRTLIMLDGMPLSELSFGTFPVAYSIPVHLIERVEVMRGPGSVLYGGAAELSVISIVTRRGSALSGSESSVRAGMFTSGTFGHADLGLAYGTQVDALEVSVLGFVGGAQLSDGRYRQLGQTPEFEHDWDSAGTLAAGLALKAALDVDTELHALAHVYESREITPPADDASSSSVRDFVGQHYSVTRFVTLGGLLRHTLHLGSHVRLIPGARYHFSHPWQPIDEGPLATDFSSVRTHRIGPTLLGTLSFHDLELSLGGELFWDLARVDPVPGTGPEVGLRSAVDQAPKRRITIRNSAAFADARYTVHGRVESQRRLNFYAGVRYDENELYGTNLAPRAALTWVLGGFHAKLMYSSAFRAPLLANTAFSDFGLDPSKPWRTPVGPERSKTAELELGQVLFEHVSVVGNGFYQVVDSIIEYRYNAAEDDVYSDNGGKLGTYGAEGEVRVSAGHYRGQANISWFAPHFFPDVNPYAYAREPKGGDTYIAPDLAGDGSARFPALLGVPRWKLYTSHAQRFLESFEVQGSALLLGPRRSTSGFGTTRRLAGQAILQLGFRYSDVAGVHGLDLGLSVHDLLGQRLKLAVPFYDSGREAFPYGGRELVLSLYFRD